jgi:hypothetical protein
MGSPNAATVMDLLSAIMPKAVSAGYVERHIQIGIEALRLIRRHGRSVRHLRFDE